MPKGACKLPHALPRMPHAMCTPTIGVHMASRRAEPARLSGGRAKPERLWTGVQALHACGLTTLIRVPKYPYKGTKVPYKGTKVPYKGTKVPLKGTKSTLIRVPKYLIRGTRTLIRVLCTLIVGLTSASQFERLT
ncbi:hypothetical protein PCANC_26779 [Puccinia coronata f. sp. avenae]|uniref:Uncharacterized protein n=1 Tax=Puccinia coronata f. sp. avenae TaxID=200324 RepID=A0A2N5TLQ9_9BASI|nr:hypothetical protein PCANC_26779 [Puccinia coronata f. sp. avenae]